MLLFEHLTGCRKATGRKPLKIQLNDEKVKNIFQEQLKQELVNHEKYILPEVAWCDVQSSVKKAVIFTSNLNPKVNKQRWISMVSLKLTSRLVPSTMSIRGSLSVGRRNAYILVVRSDK